MLQLWDTSKIQKKTSEEFINDWFRTGDIGSWSSDGSLELIDRVKNLVKLAHGEYIALENLESKFKESPFIECICVCCDPSKTFPVALVVPNHKKLTQWAEETNNPNAHDFEALCKNPKANEAVLESLMKVGKSAKLNSFEFPKVVYLCHEEWTPQNDLLTAAMKLKRAPINAKYKTQIQEMYANTQA